MRMTLMGRRFLKNGKSILTRQWLGTSIVASMGRKRVVLTIIVCCSISTFMIKSILNLIVQVIAFIRLLF